MTGVARRDFLLRMGAVVVGGGALQALTACGRDTRTVTTSRRQTDYGPLAPVPDAADGVVRLALPAGFSYLTFGVEGTPMSDGLPTPRAHDGMGAFAAGRGRVRLVRNHEVRDTPQTSVVLGDPASAYDPKAGAGTTTTVLETAKGGRPSVVSSHLSLNGTLVNCAGGVTPWGSWLTCEETTQGIAQGWSRPHGYVFDVPSDGRGVASGIPLKAMGRFVHEAVAVDPRTGIVYETEDARDSGFYRFTPEDPQRLEAGRLQMLAVEGSPGYDTRTGQMPGAELAGMWVDIADPDPVDVETNGVFAQGRAAGGAVFGRLEGCWHGRSSVFFNSTSGGDANMGQIWRYTHPGTLRLVFESPGPQVLANPDNITVTPHGGLLLCEDSGNRRQLLRGLTTGGRIFDFATNLVHDGEWAGATFSPDGRVLFVNIQGDSRGEPKKLGMSFAIWGPWESGAL